MGEPRRSGLLLPALIVLIVGGVIADVVRRSLAPAPAPAGPPAAESASVLAGRTAPASDTEDAGAARRERIRERIRDLGERTYLPGTLTDTDSTLRRWPDERIARPLKVAVMRQNVNGFSEDFVANVAWAVGRWNGVLPVGLTTGGDSATADIVITWAARLDSNRTGRTDLTWDRRGNIHHALIVLATHTPEGQALDARRISALALHELGHAMGLGHSTSRDDALYPIAMAMELSDRDRRTALLLYDLPTGSLR